MAEKFFIASTYGDAAFVGDLLHAEGHDVTLNIQKPHFKDSHTGLLPKADIAYAKPQATVLIDTTGRVPLGNHLRSRGHPVIGGNAIERLETNRGAGIRMAERLGLAVPETHTFHAVKDALRFLEKADGHYYFKPDGDVPSDLTCPASSPADMIDWINWKASTGDFQKVKSFLLQKEVKGTEIDCDGWFHPKTGFVWPFCSTVEDKKSWTGDLGASSGGVANVVWPWLTDLPALAAGTIAQYADILGEAGYVGNASVNMIIDDAGVAHFLENTIRTGFPATPAFLCLLDEGTIGEQLAAFARGELTRWELHDDDMSLSLLVSVPPYPWEDAEVARAQRGLPLDRRLDGKHPRLLVTDVMQGPRRPACSGGIGSICHVAAVGPRLPELRDKVLALADSLDIRGKQYRRDPVARFPKVLTALHDFGYDDGRFDPEEGIAA